MRGKRQRSAQRFECGASRDRIACGDNVVFARRHVDGSRPVIESVIGLYKAVRGDGRNAVDYFRRSGGAARVAVAGVSDKRIIGSGERYVCGHGRRFRGPGDERVARACGSRVSYVVERNGVIVEGKLGAFENVFENVRGLTARSAVADGTVRPCRNGNGVRVFPDVGMTVGDGGGLGNGGRAVVKPVVRALVDCNAVLREEVSDHFARLDVGLDSRQSNGIGSGGQMYI